jgi:hypothetical protein
MYRDFHAEIPKRLAKVIKKSYFGGIYGFGCLRSRKSMLFNGKTTVTYICEVKIIKTLLIFENYLADYDMETLY